MRFTRTLAAIALGAVLAVPAAFGQIMKQSDQKIDNADAAAMKQLAQANLNEIEGGKAAAAKAQMKMMVKDHPQDAKETQDLATKAKDPAFKAAVQKAHAKIQEHLQLAQRIASQQGAAAGGTSK